MDSDHNQAAGADRPPAKGGGRFALWLALFAIVIAAVVAAGIIPRLNSRAALRTETAQLATPSVVVVRPRLSQSAQEIILPATILPWTDAPIYARTNGYLRRWYADIGAQVRSGQLLAEIDTPEVDQQLSQARADLATAKANFELAGITAARYRDLLKTESVSKQDADNAEGDYAAKRAIVQSAEANVKRLEELQSFEKIYAPFDGVITVRNIDVGALIDAGSSGGPAPARELFHLAATRRLRVYVNVPQPYSQAARPGLTAELRLPEFPGRHFTGTLINTASSIDLATRTLLTQFEVPNPSGELLSGAYAEMRLQLSSDRPSYLLPANTLLFRSEGLRVVTVGPGSKAILVPITIGRDFGNEVEVIAGLNGDEQVIKDPPDSIVVGEEVRIVPEAKIPEKP
ncbi:MAG TPA: efflux RND transporter periplasmic adaptor subunit [Candidatus Acidoferrales bacterium]|nr:efflux RND transporter periplasmic adaptor subunit [Candidatus Acidoferrales bacterium]